MRYTVKKYAEALYEAALEARALPAGRQEDKVVHSFIALLTRYNDQSLLPRIIEYYEKLRRKKSGVAKVEMITAKKVSVKVKSEVEKKIGKTEVIEKIDPEVLGGVKLIINDEYLVDGTFQNRVEQLYKALMAGAEK